MNLESKIRSRQRLGFISGFIIGISFAIGWFFALDVPESELWIVFVLGLALWVLSYMVYRISDDEIPNIVAEVQRQNNESK